MLKDQLINFFFKTNNQLKRILEDIKTVDNTQQNSTFREYWVEYEYT